MARSGKNLVWIDLEMTGLVPENDAILEIATIVTDPQLEILEEGPTFVINQSDAVLARMDDFVTKLHAGSGLTADVRKSTTTLHEAENETLLFLEHYCETKKNVLCGNSIWQDRAFIRLHMPRLDAYLNYRMVDVSSIKEVLRRWYPGNPHLSFVKGDNHRALADIFESIGELKHYRKYFFIS